MSLRRQKILICTLGYRFMEQFIRQYNCMDKIYSFKIQSMNACMVAGSYKLFINGLSLINTESIWNANITRFGGRSLKCMQPTVPTYHVKMFLIWTQRAWFPPVQLNINDLPKQLCQSLSLLFSHQSNRLHYPSHPTLVLVSC